MKKFISIIIILASLLLVSCASTTPAENTEPSWITSIISTTASAQEATTAATATTAGTAATAGTVETTGTVMTSTAEITTPTDNFEFRIVGEYQSTREIPFEKLHRMDNKHRVSAEKWYTDLSTMSDMKNVRAGDYVPILMTIAGYSGEKSVITQPYNSVRYYVYRNSCGDYVSDGSIFTMETDGYPEEPVYGCYRIDIGEKYLTFMNSLIFSIRIVGNDLKNLSYLLKVVNIDGIDWVYPNIYFDFSSLKCAVRITDETEQLFYKPGKDDDIIEYLEKNSIPNPRIEYKCELNALIDELRKANIVDVENFAPVGDYTSLIDAFPFEGFAEYPEEMRKNKDDPYTPKDVIDVSKYDPENPADRDTIVKIIGYRNSEIGEDGMIYSYYYVYVKPTKLSYVDDTVYIMQAYGSPSHPYFGQRRIEIGEEYLRLETDTSFYQTDEILPATKLFYLESFEKDVFGDSPRVYPDFATDFSHLDVVFQIDDFEKYIYKEGRDDDIIEYMKENDIEPPIYDRKGYLVYFIKYFRLGKS